MTYELLPKTYLTHVMPGNRFRVEELALNGGGTTYAVLVSHPEKGWSLLLHKIHASTPNERHLVLVYRSWRRARNVARCLSRFGKPDLLIGLDEHNGQIHSKQKPSHG